ncbi:fatty acyl-AMP ligase [Oleispirillum naphthae]|uniref:fatty acyl-AMP ligase n=1 Tax=Oleispirillum naphthae TaxID=2838853 RepID=UPI0030824AD4
MTLVSKCTEADLAEEMPTFPMGTPTLPGLPRETVFRSLPEALDYAATGCTGLNFYSGHLDLVETLPYRDLRRAAISLARKLRTRGLHRGDRVALVADTSSDFVTAFAACQYGGLIAVPLPLPLAFGGRDGYIAQIRQMAEGAGISAMIAPEWVAPWSEEAMAGLDLAFHGTVGGLSEEAEAPGPLPVAEPGDLSYLQFSSGSTRTPAGIAIAHRALMSNARAIIEHGLALRPGDRCVSWLPFYHDMGLVGFLLTPIIAQISVDYMATRDFARRPLNWLRLIDRNHGTISYSPSFGYDLCAKRVAGGRLLQADLHSWRVAGIGGDMIRPHVLEQFHHAFAPLGFSASAFVPSYGLAESTLAVSFGMPQGGTRVDRVDSMQLEFRQCAVPAVNGGVRVREFVVCGRVLPGHAVEVRGETGALLEERRVGRVFVRGPSLMSGYDRRPEETAASLDAEGWLDTGDLGYMIGDELVITGRAKELIIINGRNLWPQDLEYTAEQVDGLRPGDIAAFSIENRETHEEQVVVLVQCRASDPSVRQDLAQAVAAALGKTHGIGALVVPVPNNALPMTTSGKLRRSNARKAFLAGEFTPEAPR